VAIDQQANSNKAEMSEFVCIKNYRCVFITSDFLSNIKVIVCD
jgi:hypothetical protein